MMFGGKRAIVLMMFAMLLTLFSGCSPSSSDSGQTELKIWTHPFLGGEKLNNQEDEFWKKVIAEFEKKHPGVKVNLQVLPWGNREEKILTAISSNSGPDVFYAIPDMMVDYKAKGILAPMDEYLDKNDLRDFNDNALAAARHEGKLYGLPILQSVVTNYYNVDLLKEIGANPDDLPET
jgi:multiple sugar transport system substrate-binding protein